MGKFFVLSDMTEGTHKDDWSPVPGPAQQPPQESHHASESTAQILLELCQSWCCDHFPEEPVPVLNHSLGEKPCPSKSLISFKLKPVKSLQGIHSLCNCPTTTWASPHPLIQHWTVKGMWFHTVSIPSQIQPQYIKITIWIFKSAVQPVYNLLSANSLYFSSQLQVCR